MKKFWKNRSGVSPVIATLLLIGITVILSSVVFVMVMGLGESQDKPTADLSASSISGDQADKVTITSINKAVDYASMKVAVIVGDQAKTQNLVESYPDGIWPAGIHSITFIDRAGNGKVDTGDYFLVDADQGTEITLHLIYEGDAGSIAMVTWTSL